VNWDAIGAVGELLGALAVVITLAYLANQVRYAKAAANDANRLARATGVREMVRTMASNDALSQSLARTLGNEDWYGEYAQRFGVSLDDALRTDWHNIYYFWLHWGQFGSSKTDEDQRELENIIARFYANPAVRHSWDQSPWGKRVFAPEFVSFVDAILAEVPADDSAPAA
jgi:hypothetical protein